jgi:hypothetical protein
LKLFASGLHYGVGSGDGHLTPPNIDINPEAHRNSVMRLT